MSNERTIIFITFRGTPKGSRALYQGGQNQMEMQQMVRWYESQGSRLVSFEDNHGRWLDINSFPLVPPAPMEKKEGK